MKFRKFFIIPLMMMSLCFCFVGCKDDNSSGDGNSSSKQVPIYQGMEVSDNYLVEEESSAVSYGSGLDNNHDNHDNNHKHDGWHGGDCNNRNEDVDKNNPFGKPNGSDTEEKVSSLVVVGSVQEAYYAEKNESVFVSIKIYNPDQFEILSFTLNNKKYAVGFDFEEGSTLENLIIKVDVGDVCGIKDYTIDAIKYVEGTEIKDVIMEGDKTIKIAIKADQEPTAIISNQQIFADSIKFDVNLQDPLSLIEKSEGETKAVLYDGENIIAQKQLTLGNNNVEFANLQQNTLYEIAIVSAYNNYTESEDVHVIETIPFYTDTFVLFDSTKVEITKTSASWDYSWHSSMQNKTIVSQELFLGEEKIATLNVSAKTATGLLSGKNYTLKTTYKDTSNKNQTIELQFVTYSKVEPTIEFKNVTSTKTSISFDFSITDTDNIYVFDKIELLKGSTVAKTITDTSKVFNDLTSGTEHTLKAYYHYDLNDGKGSKSKTITFKTSTQVDISLSNTKVANTSAVKFGEVIYMQAFTQDLNSSIKCKTAKVNGNNYEIIQAGNNLYIEIVNNGQFAGGDTALQIESIDYEINGTTFTYPITTNNTASIFINGILTINDIYLYDADKKEKLTTDFITENQNVYVMFDVNNETGYEIYNFNFSGQYGTNTLKLTKIDNNHWYINLSDLNLEFPDTKTVTKLYYKNVYIDDIATGNYLISPPIKVKNEKPIQISTAAELQSLENHYQYELAQDIDLSGIEWLPKNFTGIFDGKGFAIKNLTHIASYENKNISVALFSDFMGIIKNVNMKSVTILLNVNDDYSSASAFALTAKDSTFINCTIDKSSIIHISKRIGNETIPAGYVSSFVCDYWMPHNYAKFENCTTYAQLNGQNVYGFIGGINGNNGYFTNCISSGTYIGVNVSAFTPYSNTYYDTAIFENCLNTSNNKNFVSEKDNIYSELYNCIIYQNNEIFLINHSIKTPLSIEQLNSKTFWTETMGWSESVWNFNELDFEFGEYPKLITNNHKKTIPTLSINNLTPTKNSATFNISVNDPDSAIISTKVELLHGSDDPILLTLSTTNLSDLLSNNTYTIKITYTFNTLNGAGNQTAIKKQSFSTQAYQAPKIEYINVVKTQTSCEFNLNITSSELCNITEIALYDRTSNTKLAVLDKNALYKFEGLTEATMYYIKTSFSYDLNDGNGVVNDYMVRNFCTDYDDYLIACVYIKINSEGFITDINSDCFIQNFTDWILIDEGFGDRFSHAQSQYFDYSIQDIYGTGNYNYKYEHGIAVYVGNQNWY